ncbi:MgtC/SapB family protein [Nanoarchaeota archaeon]
MEIMSLGDLLKLFLAVVIGAIVGFEREKIGKPAGLRTHILVCLGSTLATMISVDYFIQDSARVVSSVVAGIGFIGAGTIIAGRNTKGVVTGLTTAASIWVVGAIGIAIGVGNYSLAAVAGIIVLVILLLGRFEKSKISRK